MKIPGQKSNIAVTRLGAVLCAFLLLTSCLLDDDRRARDARSGYVVFELKLERSRSLLVKVSATDTIFALDSLLIMLTAPDADTVVYREAFSGRADTGSILVTPRIYSLAALRNWTAHVYTIDEQADPLRRDTVHHDSLVFAVLPADTVVVSKTVSPAFAILRARFLSNVADSIPDKVFYLRVRVDGVTRDSVVLGGKNATLRWLQTLPGSVIFAAGDSGRILKSVNDAQTSDDGAWTETVVSTQPLVGGHFPNATHGYVVSAGGQVFKTENGGNSWTARASTADSLNAAWFTSSAQGWAVGQNGGIYKTTNDANSWYGTMVSNTTHHLRGVHFPSATIGFVVGENETILRTRNGNGSDALPEFGGVVWEPVAGGWFNQTSQEPSRDFKDILFSSQDTGWAVGSGGLARLTFNSGATWQIREIGGISGKNLNALATAGAWNKVFAVADNGEIFKAAGEYDWQLSYGSGDAGTGTTEDLHDIAVVNAGDTAYVVGDNGTILRATNAGTYSWPYVSWSAQTLPPDGAGSLSPWDSASSNTSSALNGVHFASSTTGWTVGANGVIRKSTDGGRTWMALTTASATLHDVHAPSTSVVVAVGAGGLIRRSTDGGATWASPSSGVTDDLRGVYIIGDASYGWAAGASGKIRRTTDGGATWSTQNSGVTDRLNAVASNGSDRVLAVGDNGRVRRRNNFNNNDFTDASNATIGTRQLNGIYMFPGSNTAVVVGNGGFIARCTHNNNNNWAQKSAGLTTENLLKVHFTDANNGFIVGASGTILKSTDAGESWSIVASGTARDLADVHMLNGSKVVVVGAAGTIRRTITGGDTGVPAFNMNSLRSVDAVTSTTVYVAGENGTIGKTVNAGTSWTLLNSGTTQDLYSIDFLTPTTGWVVGRNGTILKTTDGGATWVAQSSGTTAHLSSLDIRTADTVYATGTSGFILKTVDGGATWYGQESPLTQDLNRVYFYNSAKGWAVGNGGRIINAVNQGDNWTGGGIKRSLKGVYFTSVSTGWIVGDDGVILKSTDTGTTWVEQHRQSGLQLYGIHFIDANTGWVTGEGGVILKTTDGGASWTPQASGTGIDLQWVNFRDANRGFVIGGTESILETTNGGANWAGLFVGVPGERTFDRLLTYKYIKPGQSQRIILEAMDRFSLPLRGYQSVFDLTIGAGRDSTITAPLARCGHVDSLPCVE